MLVLNFLVACSAGFVGSLPSRSAGIQRIRPTHMIDSMGLLRQSEVLEVLTTVRDAALADIQHDLDLDVVSLGVIKGVTAGKGDVQGYVTINFEFSDPEQITSGAPDRLRRICTERLLSELDWVEDVEIKTSFARPTEPPTELSPDGTAGTLGGTDGITPVGVRDVKHIVSVASCKGGVGKSTTATNLAFALSARGLRIGLVDLDVHGPSLPTMVTPDAPLQRDGERLLPLTAYGVKLMSMGYLNPSLLPLRGAKLTPVVQQLVGRTEWGELDYLICDMPPGTGDVQLTLSQDFRVDATVLVTTPQRLSFVDVVKGIEMFDNVGIPTIAIMENMCGLESLPNLESAANALVAKHELSAEFASDLEDALASARADLFGDSHVEQLQSMWGIEASFSLPLLPSIAASADNGVPFVISSPATEAAEAYRKLAAAVQREVEGLPEVVLPQLFYLSAERTILIGRPDGMEPQRITPLALRKLCRSPSNKPDALPDDLEPLDFQPIGNYAVSVRWSDGHQSLLPYASFLEEDGGSASEGAGGAFPSITFGGGGGKIGE